MKEVDLDIINIDNDNNHFEDHHVRILVGVVNVKDGKYLKKINEELMAIAWDMYINKTFIYTNKTFIFSKVLFWFLPNLQRINKITKNLKSINLKTN